MKKTEITTLWDKMLDRFPDWLDTKPADDFGRTEVAWCNALAEFEECSADWVWNRMLERFRQHAEESPKFSFKPPGLDSICNHIRKALADHRRTLRQDTDAKLLADDREEERCEAPEFFKELTRRMEKEAADRLSGKLGLKGPMGEPLKYNQDETPLKAEDFEK